MLPSERADRGHKVVAQQYDFPTVQLRYTNQVDASKAYTVKSCQGAAEYLRDIFDDFIEHHEEFYVLLLNRGNKVVGVHNVGKGGINATVADPRIILQAAVLSNCSGLIMAHNHPSGSLAASQQDIDLTKRIADLCRLLGINLLDHIILVPGLSYFSFSDKGML